MDDKVSAATLHEWDHRYVWHPFTPMKDYDQADPVLIAAGDGVRLQDVEGRWYYDGVSSIWLNVHGHRVPAIDGAIRDQLDRIAHSTLLGQGSVPVTKLARRLADWVPPGLTRFFFSESGASAVEVALKMAVQFWANQGVKTKTRVMGFTSNYHGDTLGAMAVAPDPVFHWPFLEYLPEEPRAPYPYCYRCPVGREWGRCGLECVDAAEETLAANADRLAAVIIEPVQGAGGIIPAPVGYLARLRELCDRYGVLLIVDEVATGIGRTGRLWGSDHDGVSPDIMCLGKGLSGGYLPISVTCATERIYQAFYATAGERRALYHGHSFAGNALAAAAALANLDLIEKTGLLESLAEKSEIVARGLARLADLPYVGDIRQRGLMVGIELVEDRKSRRPFAYAAQAGYVVAGLAREAGLLIRPIGHIVIFMPPPGASAGDIAEMTRLLAAAVEAAMPVLARLSSGAEETACHE